MAPARLGCLALAAVLRVAAASLDTTSFVQVDVGQRKEGKLVQPGLAVNDDGKPKSKRQIQKEIMEMDINKIGSKLPRQMTSSEIERVVVSFSNYTQIVRRMPEVSSEWMAPLTGPPAAIALAQDLEGSVAGANASSDISGMVASLDKSFRGVKKVFDLHQLALKRTYDDSDRNSPHEQALANRPAQQALVAKASEISEAAEHGRQTIAGATTAPELCSKASTALTELRKQSKDYAKGCDVLLFVLPPPLPENNPWMNATMLETVRSMYTASKNAIKDVGDSVENGVINFVRTGAGCEVEVVEPIEVSPEVEQKQQKGGSRSSAPRAHSAFSTVAAAACAALVALGSRL